MDRESWRECTIFNCFDNGASDMCVYMTEIEGEKETEKGGGNKK